MTSLIDLGKCWLILSCSLRNARQSYGQSQWHTHSYKTELRKSKSTNPLGTAGRIDLVEIQIFCINYFTVDLICF